MLVAPPGAFKSTVTETLNEFATTTVISDINVQSLLKMKDSFLSQRITTMAFSDFAKLYKRHGATADNVEGILMALVEEGFRKASFESQTTGCIPAYCTVIGGMTTSFFESKVDDWEDNGFLRRFLFARYRVQGLEVIEEAIQEWRRVNFNDGFIPKVPNSRLIPYKLEKPEIAVITRGVIHQHSTSGANIAMQKIYCVLKWKFQKEPERAMFILKDFLPCLSKEGGTLLLKEKKTDR